jgi:signal transduction histidine kinase
LNIYEYTKEFLGILGNSINISFINNLKTEVLKKVQILEWTIVLQNLVSNSKKAGADEIKLTFMADGRKLLLDFSDNGIGVNLEKFTPESIFKLGITDRQGGSGIGLNTVQSAMRDKLNGSIEFLGNGLNNMEGATFRLTFE